MAYGLQPLANLLDEGVCSDRVVGTEAASDHAAALSMNHLVTSM